MHPGQILLGIFIGIIVAIVGWITKITYRRRQLFLIQPKLFDYSGLGPDTQSKTIEITVINSGRRSEEAVQVQFSPTFTYEILASSTPGLRVDTNGLLLIERLTPKQQITVIILVTGGEFRKDHIMGITSKDALGKIKNTIQDARTSNIAAASAALIFVLFFIGFGYAAGIFINPLIWPTVQQYIFRCEPVDYQITNRNLNGTYQIGKQIENALASTVAIVSICRTGSYIRVALNLINETKDRLTYNLSLSAASDDLRPLGNTDYVLGGQILYPGMKKSVTLIEYLPKDAKPQKITFESTVEMPDSTQVSTAEDINLSH